jgi:hypothetical protein
MTLLTFEKVLLAAICLKGHKLLDSFQARSCYCQTTLLKRLQESFTDADQANYLADNIPALTQKVDNVFWYELIDNQNLNPPKENYFGLIDLGYHRKPAYVELKRLIETVP